jgi:hypothetical protein
MPSFDFGRFDVADFRLACLLIAAASNAAIKSGSRRADPSGVIRQITTGSSTEEC